MIPTDRCMGCMSPRTDSAPHCPTCGYAAGSPPESPLHLTPGTELHNQYIIGRVLGHGGFGITYLGWDKNLERKLAIKEYFPGGIATRAGSSTVSPFQLQQQKDFDYGLERYLEEARMLARFNNHPHILSVLNFFRENGTAYIVTEFLEGITLEQHIDRHGGRIKFEEALELLVPIMKALEDVHAGGILHRDVSPDNIHIGRQVKLLDFGAARIALGERSRNLSVILKEGYAPPEQYRSKGNQGPWTDVYALAATLYRAITGVHVPPALDRMGEDDLTPPLALGAAMTVREEAAILKALSFNWQDRFATMKEFRQSILLTTTRGETPVTASGPVQTGRSIAETPTIVAVDRSHQHVSAEFPTHAPPSKPLVPAWVWSVVGGIGVLAILFALRPQTQPTTPDPPPTKVEQVALPTPAPQPTPTPTPPAPAYDELIQQAEAQAENAPAAITLLQQAIQNAPQRPEAHDTLAQIHLYRQNNLPLAEAAYRKSLELGGAATFHVTLLPRDSDGANLAPGKLRIARDTIAYTDPTTAASSFTTTHAAIAELKRNRELSRFLKAKILAQGLFHIRLNNGENYNFIGHSKEKDKERDLILSLAGEK